MEEEQVKKSQYIFSEIYINSDSQVIYRHDPKPHVKKRPRRNPKKKDKQNNNNESKAKPKTFTPRDLTLYAGDEVVVVERIKGFGRLVL